MDNSNTYGIIDTADVTVGQLTVAATSNDVHLEVAAGRKLTVDTNLVLGSQSGSSGKITLNKGSVLTVNGDLAVGDGGSGILEVKGGKIVVAGVLSIGSFFVVELSDSASITVSGDLLDTFYTYLQADQLLPNSGMQTYAVFDVTKNRTTVHGPASGTVRSYACGSSDTTTVVTEFYPGDTLELEKSSTGTLCTLVEVNSQSDTYGKTDLGMTPLGRSYNSYDWEPYGGDFSSIRFDCSQGSKCKAYDLPLLRDGRSYVLKPYTGPDLTNDEITARFLEKATFGPTKTDIGSFTSKTDWLTLQFNAPITSHRAVFRSHLTHWHAESNYHTLLHTNACGEGARYRKYAFVNVDIYRYMKVTNSIHDASKVIISVDDQIRTVVDGPIQCGNWQGPDGRILGEGSYHICNHPLDGVEGRIRVRSGGVETSSCDCDVLFGTEYGE
jgi:T5SS/PEP-CTERM-associated repeat protein